MADFYLAHAIGVKDGTKSPPDKYDGRIVGAKKKSIVAVKPAVTYAAGDRLFLCELDPNEQITDIKVVSDTSFGTTTLSIGTTGTPAKYASARTMTVTDVPTSIGLRATAADDGPLASAEDVWITLGVGGIASGVIATFYVEITSSS